MTIKETVEEKLEKLGRAIGSDDSLVENLMRRIDAGSVDESPRAVRSNNKLITGRFTMNYFWKIAAAAAIIAAVALSIVVIDKLTSQAYAFVETLEAVKDVQFIHIVSRDEAGRAKDERWIEIGPDGFQVRYRQDNPPNFFVVEDGETVSVYYKDKNTIVLYDPKDRQYQWIGNLGEWLKELAGQGGIVIEENVDYWGRKAHRVRWLKLNQECYVDPETKLPIGIGGYQISYETPPEGTFDIVIGTGVIVVDKRPGAEPTEEPEWLDTDEIAHNYFNNARHALAAGNYEEAVELFAKVVEQDGRNWAWFWLGKAHYELGEYDTAIYDFTKVIDMFAEHQSVPHYCNLARGQAYAAKGMKDMARHDLEAALPPMIETLRNIEGATMFDYADDPLYRSLPKEQRPNAQQSLAMMINRLRIITGQNFGYDPDGIAEENEQAIAAWEEWYKNSGKIEFNPDAVLVPVPETVEPAEE
ncbi:MAG: tetratricopeptide repeat protein [Phycisphaerae bacterium]|nr:tetratricopeptide repeat protein [Phycisphaerae bacterium]